jgi:hypothetical protein
MKGWRLRKLLASCPVPKDRVSLLYMEILSRTPTSEEQKIALDYIASSGQIDNGSYDLAWALINTSEFSLKH